MTSWMTLVEPKDHILKVSCHYLYFWQRYKGVTKRDKNVTDRQRDRQRDKGTQLKFNIDLQTKLFPCINPLVPGGRFFYQATLWLFKHAP